MRDLQKYQINIRSLRENEGKTQKEIADKLGIEQTVYSRYETGRCDIKPHLIVKLCNLYRVSADYILGLPEGRPYGNNHFRLKNQPKSKFDKLSDEVRELIKWAEYQEHISYDAKETLLYNLENIINDIQGGGK